MSGDTAQDPIDIEDLTQEIADESFPTTKERLEDIKAIFYEALKKKP